MQIFSRFRKVVTSFNFCILRNSHAPIHSTCFNITCAPKCQSGNPIIYASFKPRTEKKGDKRINLYVTFFITEYMRVIIKQN